MKMTIYPLVSILSILYCVIMKGTSLNENKAFLNVIDFLYPLSVIKISIFFLIYRKKRQDDKHHILLIFSIIEIFIFVASVFLLFRY